MKPTLGRIVHYMEGGEVYPAIVVHVVKDSPSMLADLAVWNPDATQVSKIAVPFSKEIAKDDCHWFWPPVPMPTPEDMKKLRDRIAAQTPRPPTEVKS